MPCGDDPQELNAQIDAARTQIELARSQVESWQVDVERAQRTRDKYAWDKSTEGKAAHAVALSQLKAARAGLKTAQASLAGAERDLENLLDMRDNPLEAAAAVDAAWWVSQTAEAGMQVAEARLASMRATPDGRGASSSPGEAGRSGSGAGRTKGATLEKMRISSPIGGLVTSRSIHVGEMAAPGGALLRVSESGRGRASSLRTHRSDRLDQGGGHCPGAGGHLPKQILPWPSDLHLPAGGVPPQERAD